MPILRINALGDRPLPADEGALDAALDRALARLRPDAPLVILVHGYKHSPHVAGHCPHGHILSLAPRRGGRALSWPRHLGFGRGAPGEGLAVAFGWHARGTIWQAWREAETAGHALAALVARISERHARPVGLFAHSLGARVCLAALPALPAGSVRRLVMLAGAEFGDRAAEALDSPAGRRAQVLNVTSGENLLFDLLLERLLQPPWATRRALGAGLPDLVPSWVDLRIDDPETRAHLARLGFRIPPPVRPVCHWSGYMRPGLFALYRALLVRDAPLPVQALRLPARPRREDPGRDRLFTPA